MSMEPDQWAGMSCTAARSRLIELRAERDAAVEYGLCADVAYMNDLLGEIDQVRHAYVGAAVTEIAMLRARLSGPLHG